MIARLLVACVAALALIAMTLATAWSRARKKGDTHTDVVVSAKGERWVQIDIYEVKSLRRQTGSI